MAVNWTALPSASAVVGLRLTDCKIRGRGDEAHAKVIEMARTARKKTEKLYSVTVDLLPLGFPDKNSGMPAEYFLKHSLRSCNCCNRAIAQRKGLTAIFHQLKGLLIAKDRSARSTK